ncbi:MAG TPA: protein-disulfide reductase DsbD domain-containing protein, partial [Sphingomicrobium sp.]|nr:protein-disulfide reductase DsbD domain-containing protein [Sphingomicrobium sp.]
MQRVVLALAGLTSTLSGFAPGLPQHIDVRLITESNTPRPGHGIFLGLQMTPQPGWHGYWSNPGEAGLAPAVKWTAPSGVHFGPLQHPA